MDTLVARIQRLKWRTDALLSENLPESSRFLLTEEAGPHIEAAFASCMKRGAAAEYHWAYADSYISFVEDGQKQLATMIEELERLCPGD